VEDVHASACHCLYLVQQLQVFVRRIGDLAVWEAAQRVQLTPGGSLGIVLRAYRQSIFSLMDAKHAFMQRYDVNSLFGTT